MNRSMKDEWDFDGLVRRRDHKEHSRLKEEHEEKTERFESVNTISVEVRNVAKRDFCFPIMEFPLSVPPLSFYPITP